MLLSCCVSPLVAGAPRNKRPRSQTQPKCFIGEPTPTFPSSRETCRGCQESRTQARAGRDGSSEVMPRNFRRRSEGDQRRRIEHHEASIERNGSFTGPLVTDAGLEPGTTDVRVVAEANWTVGPSQATWSRTHSGRCLQDRTVYKQGGRRLTSEVE